MERHNGILIMNSTKESAQCIVSQWTLCLSSKTLCISVAIRLTNVYHEKCLVDVDRARSGRSKLSPHDAGQSDGAGCLPFANFAKSYPDTRYTIPTLAQHGRIARRISYD